MENTNQTSHKSKAWIFIATALFSLLLFLLNGITIVSSNGSESPSSLNTLLAFILACTTLGAAIGSNVSAYLNPESPFATRILSPLVFFVAALLIIPSLATLGLSVIG